MNRLPAMDEMTADAVIDADALINSGGLPTLDVRSPSEFSRGHIPGASNVPLLDDAERAEVGTIYKRQGSKPAITRGREIVGAKLDQLVDEVQAIASRPDLIVHCWRGGMRSRGFAGLLRSHGYQPKLLDGGYKAFRQAAHRCFTQKRRIIILGGKSGSGKTRLLGTLQSAGEQVIDLERLANHRGSVFGGIDQPPQPTVEQFENELFLQWRSLDPQRTVWMESESQLIGKVFLPQQIWEQMAAAPVFFLEVGQQQRAEFLVHEYGHLPTDQLAIAVDKIRKRLGGERHRLALEALERKDVHTFAELALQYYDKAYSKSLLKFPRRVVIHVPLDSPGQADAVKTLCRLADDLPADPVAS